MDQSPSTLKMNFMYGSVSLPGQHFSVCVYIYICANLHPRCRLAFYTHTQPTDPATSPPRQTRSALLGPPRPCSNYPFGQSPNLTRSGFKLLRRLRAARERRPHGSGGCGSSKQRSQAAAATSSGVVRRWLCEARKLRRRRAARAWRLRRRGSCGGVELQGAEAAAARKQRGVEAAVALSGMVRKRLIGVLNKRPACRGCRDA